MHKRQRGFFDESARQARLEELGDPLLLAVRRSVRANDRYQEDVLHAVYRSRTRTHVEGQRTRSSRWIRIQRLV